MKASDRGQNVKFLGNNFRCVWVIQLIDSNKIITATVKNSTKWIKARTACHISHCGFTGENIMCYNLTLQRTHRVAF